MTALTVHDIGHAPYEPTLAMQLRLVEQVRRSDNEQAHLVLVEHDPPVVTLGRSAGDTNVVGSPDDLAAAGIEVHQATRGGDVTYHGPGQLVGYPILRIDRPGRGLHQTLRDLEEVHIRLLARLGLTAHRDPQHTGVWVGHAKVTAIGIAVRRWVTYHGFALNVCPNLSHFDLIIPCGITDRTVTSLAALLDRPITVAQIKPMLIQCFTDVFGFDEVRYEPPAPSDIEGNQS